MKPKDKKKLERFNKFIKNKKEIKEVYLIILIILSRHTSSTIPAPGGWFDKSLRRLLSDWVFGLP